VELLENNRLHFQVDLQEHGKNVKLLKITVKSGLGIVAGRQIQLIEPAISVNGGLFQISLLVRSPPISVKKLDLGSIRTTGALLKLKVRQDELEIAAFFYEWSHLPGFWKIAGC